MQRKVCGFRERFHFDVCLLTLTPERKWKLNYYKVKSVF